MAPKTQAKSNSRASRAPKPQPPVTESTTYPTTRKPTVYSEADVAKLRAQWDHEHQQANIASGSILPAIVDLSKFQSVGEKHVCVSAATDSAPKATPSDMDQARTALEVQSNALSDAISELSLRLAPVLRTNVESDLTVTHCDGKTNASDYLYAHAECLQRDRIRIFALLAALDL